MEKTSAITPEMRNMVGKEHTFSSPEELGRATIHRFARAIGDLNPLYLDEDFAKKSRHRGIIAPPTMIFELTHNIGDEISEEDGGYQDKVTLPAPFSRLIRGGNEYEFCRPPRPTDKITVKRKITKMLEKQGKAGPMILGEVELTYSNHQGQILGKNRETYIFLPEKAA